MCKEETHDDEADFLVWSNRFNPSILVRETRALSEYPRQNLYFTDTGYQYNGERVLIKERHAWKMYYTGKLSRADIFMYKVFEQKSRAIFMETSKTYLVFKRRRECFCFIFFSYLFCFLSKVFSIFSAHVYTYNGVKDKENSIELIFVYMFNCLSSICFGLYLLFIKFY